MALEEGPSFVVDGFSDEACLHLFEGNATDEDYRWIARSEPVYPFGCKLLVELDAPLFSFFPSFLKIRSIAIQWTGASASGAGFYPFSYPLPNRSPRKTNTRSTISGRESLSRKLKDLLIPIQTFCLMRLSDMIPSRFPCPTCNSSLVLRPFFSFSFLPSSFFEGVFFSLWCLLLRSLADLRPHPCQKGHYVLAQIFMK